jgi:hypothetical protein
MKFIGHVRQKRNPRKGVTYNTIEIKNKLGVNYTLFTPWKPDEPFEPGDLVTVKIEMKKKADIFLPTKPASAAKPVEVEEKKAA